MDRFALYKLLDIEAPEEFVYYENLAALLEADEEIAPELLEDLLAKLEGEALADLTDSYFDEFEKAIPEEYGDLCLAVDTARRSLLGRIVPSPDAQQVAELAEAISAFRRWYVHACLVKEVETGEYLNVRDARYNLSAARLLGEECRYDFGEALKYESDGYTVRVRDLLEQENYDQD